MTEGRYSSRPARWRRLCLPSAPAGTRKHPRLDWPGRPPRERLPSIPAYGFLHGVALALRNPPRCYSRELSATRKVSKSRVIAHQLITPGFEAIAAIRNGEIDLQSLVSLSMMDRLPIRARNHKGTRYPDSPGNPTVLMSSSCSRRWNWMKRSSSPAKPG